MTHPLPPQLPESPPPLPGAARGSRREAGQGGRCSKWALGLLVAACLALGISVGWGRHAWRQAGRLTGELEGMRVQLALSAAGDSQLAALLTSDSVELVALRPTSAAAGRRAAVVWDRKLGNGFLFCDSLWPAGAGRHYHLLIRSGKASVEDAARFDAQTGTTVVRFHASASSPPVHFELSVRPDAKDAAGQTLFSGNSF